MAVNKLNIEFEDDEEIRAREEAQRKKSEALGDVDLSFGDEDEAASAAKARPQSKSRPATESAPSASKTEKPAANQRAQVASREQVREAPRAQAQTGGHQDVDFQQLPTRQVYVGPEYKLGDELKKIGASNQILAIEIEARVKVEVTQQITELIAEHHAKNKLLEHKINKLLTGIHQKAPAVKAELMAIKKLLKEQASLGSENDPESEPKSEVAKAAPARVAPKKKAA